ncbi:MAG: helix-turn-helix transcriptional regulator [Flavobacteriia bacterium]|nr:helix-turn-helix transcriptional regulator [Flavobacteriia bacterium]
MKLHERIKAIREDKSISQEAVAFALGMSQSQYSRRENGEVKFNADEIIDLSKKLETKISDLYGEETTTLYNHNQKGGNFGVGYYVMMPEKLIEQYEKRLQEKDEMIALLKMKI